MAIKRDIIYAQCEKAGVRSPMVIPASPDIQSLMGTVFFTKRTTSWAIKEAMTTINHLSVMTRRTGFQTCLTQIAVLCCMAWQSSAFGNGYDLLEAVTCEATEIQKALVGARLVDHAEELETLGALARVKKSADEPDEPVRFKKTGIITKDI